MLPLSSAEDLAMTDRVKTDQNQVLAFTPPRSPLRVMNILEELAGEPMGLALVRLCERLDLPKTSLMSLLRALEEENYVTKDNGLYRLGEAALRLSSLISASLPFPHSVHDHLVELMSEWNETVMLATLSEDGEAAIYVDKAESRRAIRYSGFIGSRRPLYCTAIGKALLAFQDKAFISKYLENTTLTSHGAHTITEKDILRQELQKIRRNGLSVAIDELTEGIGVYAAPVFDANRQVVAAVSIAAPADRARAMGESYGAAIRATAQKISSVLGSEAD
jgi:DNA-binding IclR family transcriptional regulator